MSNVLTHKVSKVLGVVALAVAFSFALSAMTVQADEDLQSQIDALLATIASLQSQLSGEPAVSGYQFTSNLTLGSTGEAVRQLQIRLNAEAGIQVAASGPGSPGNETTYFGALTQSAVVAYQNMYAETVLTPVGLTAGTGFVGPSTRAKLNATVGTTPVEGTTPVVDPTLPSVEGRIEASRLATPGNQIGDLKKGAKNVAVYGFSVEAKESQIDVRRVDINFNSALTERQIARLIDSVAISVGGEVIDSRSFTRDSVITNGSNYEIRLSGFSERVAKDSTKNFVVHVSVTDNADYILGNNITVTIPTDGIRGIDQAGLNQFASVVAPRTFSVDTTITAEITASKDSDSPKTAIVLADEDNSTNGVKLLSFELEVENGSVVIEDLPVSITSNNASSHDDFLGNISLVYKGDTIGSEEASSLTGTQVYTFEDLDLDLGVGKHVFHLEIDLLKWDVAGWEGMQLSAELTSANVNAIVSEDSEGDVVAPSELDGSAAGEVMYVYTAAPSFALISSALTASGDNQNIGTANIQFKVTAQGDDIYIADFAGTSYAASTGSATGTILTPNTALSATAASSWNAIIESDATRATGNGWIVKKGQSENFEISVVMEGSSTDDLAQLRVLLDDVRWSLNTNLTGLNVVPGDILETFRTPLRTVRVK